MSDEHRNEPREVGYNKAHKEIYKEWTKKESNSIFAGANQADLFLFAMGVGFHREKKSEPKSKANDIPTQALRDDQKWSILSTEIAAKKDLLVLKDEETIYSEAEKYADEGINIVKSHVEKYGLDYPKFLEAELKELLGTNKNDTTKNK